MGNNYEQDLAIDPFILHEEVLRQPSLFSKYSDLTSEAERERDQIKERIVTLKADLDRVKAELDQAIRSDPSKFIPHKDIKEASITGAVILHPDYKKALALIHTANLELIEADYTLSHLYGSVKSFDHRKAMLELSVRLWERGYWSAPNLPHEISEGGKRMVEVARDQVSSRMREEVNRSQKEEEELKKLMEPDQPRRRRQ